MSELKIRTNGHYRPVLCWENLTEKERAEFDKEVFYNSSFFRYRGWVYTLDDFMRVEANSPVVEVKHRSLKGLTFIIYEWDGVHADGFFSGVLVKYSSCGDAVKVGRYTCCKTTDVVVQPADKAHAYVLKK